MVDDVPVSFRADSDCSEQLILELCLVKAAVGLIVLAWESTGNINHIPCLDREFELAEAQLEVFKLLRDFWLNELRYVLAVI